MRPSAFFPLAKPYGSAGVIFASNRQVLPPPKARPTLIAAPKPAPKAAAAPEEDGGWPHLLENMMRLKGIHGQSSPIVRPNSAETLFSLYSGHQALSFLLVGCLPFTQGKRAFRATPPTYLGQVRLAFGPNSPSDTFILLRATYCGWTNSCTT